jgi:hypothetical protein
VTSSLTRVDTVPIIRVYNENKTLCILIVVPPERSDLVLSSDIPHCETYVLVFDGFDVESCLIWDGRLIDIFR